MGGKCRYAVGEVVIRGGTGRYAFGGSPDAAARAGGAIPALVGAAGAVGAAGTAGAAGARPEEKAGASKGPGLCVRGACAATLPSGAAPRRHVCKRR